MTTYIADFTDSRLQPGAYVTNGQHLYEVRWIDTKANRVTVENVKDGQAMSLSACWLMGGHYELVREAPTVADTVGGEMELVPVEDPQPVASFRA